MHSRPKLHAPATQVPRQDPASTTCPHARRPALRLVRSSTILPAASACRPKLHIPAPIPQQDVPAPPLARSLVVLLRRIPYSCPCVSSAAPRQESPPLPLTRSLVILFHALSIVVPDSQRAAGRIAGRT